MNLDKLKRKFSQDIMNNLNMAEKMGVFRVIKNMSQDAKKAIYEMEEGDSESQRSSRGLESRDGPSAADSNGQFPGYEDRVKEIEQRVKE